MKGAITDKLDAESLCRTCNMNKGNHSFQEIALSSHCDEETTLYQMLLDVAQINMTDGGICEVCKDKLVGAFAFIQQVRKVNGQYLSNVEIKEEEFMEIPRLVGKDELLEAKEFLKINEDPICSEEDTAHSNEKPQQSCFENVHESDESTDSSENSVSRSPVSFIKKRTRNQSKEHTQQKIYAKYGYVVRQLRSASSKVHSFHELLRNSNEDKEPKRPGMKATQSSDSSATEETSDESFFHESDPRKSVENKKTSPQVRLQRLKKAKKINRSANKHCKVEGIHESLCKPHGNKIIKCMLCDSQHAKLADLRAHLVCHRNQVSIVDGGKNVNEKFQRYYPELPKPAKLDEETLIECIRNDIDSGQLERFYSIVNEFGNELSLDSSETDTEDDQDCPDTRQAKATNEPGKYVCHLCGLSFNRKYQAFQHQNRKHDWESVSYSCSYCSCRFIDKTLLDWHLNQQCESKKKHFVCKKCQMRFMWKENLEHHMHYSHPAKTENVHSVVHKIAMPLLKCLFCPRNFSKEQSLHMHIIHHGVFASHLPAVESILHATLNQNGAKNICCKICKKKFESISALRKHFQKQSTCAKNVTIQGHCTSKYSIINALGFEMDINDSETELEEDSEKAAVTDKQYTCQLCDSAQFKRKFELARHQHSKHRYEVLPLKCDKCVFRTVNADILAYHKRTQCENTEKLNKCNLCGFKFMWPENLETHKTLLHGRLEASEGNSKFQCTQCPRRYSRKDRLTAHVKAKHSTQKIAEPRKKDSHSTLETSEVALTYQCTECPQKYSRKGGLLAHLKKMHSKPTAVTKCTRHSQKEPSSNKYLCALCGRSLSSADVLKVHMRRHTGEKPFKCDSCDMAFPRSSDLHEHRRIHTGERPHACNVCGKSFHRANKLLLHSRVHSGEKPYKCTFKNCEKSFAQSNDLKLHMRRHTGEKPYACGICGERFIQGTALRNHRTLNKHFEPEQPKRSLLENF